MADAAPMSNGGVHHAELSNDALVARRTTLTELMGESSRLRAGQTYFLVAAKWCVLVNDGTHANPCADTHTSTVHTHRFGALSKHLGMPGNASTWSKDSSTSPLAPQPKQSPGPICNRALLERTAPPTLSTGLMFDVDYVVVPEVAWDKLQQWYSIHSLRCVSTFSLTHSLTRTHDGHETGTGQTLQLHERLVQLVIAKRYTWICIPST